jgi:hypothetical protein
MATSQTLLSPEIQSNPQDETGKTRRLDKWALWGGVLFAFAFTAPFISLRPPSRFSSSARSGIWYYWKLAEPTNVPHHSLGFLSRASDHSLGTDLVCPDPRRNIRPLHRVNIVALAANAVFIGLHFVRRISGMTASPRMSIFSSQGSSSSLV